MRVIKQVFLTGIFALFAPISSQWRLVFRKGINKVFLRCAAGAAGARFSVRFEQQLEADSKSIPQLSCGGRRRLAASCARDDILAPQAPAARSDRAAVF
jgi:hypothetical protein